MYRPLGDNDSDSDSDSDLANDIKISVDMSPSRVTFKSGTNAEEKHDILELDGKSGNIRLVQCSWEILKGL